MPNDWYQFLTIAFIVFDLWLQYRKMPFHSNAGMRLHSDHIIQIFLIIHLLLLVCITIRLHKSIKLCVNPFRNDIFWSKNNTLHNHIMTDHIFEHHNVYFDEMFPYVNNTLLSPIVHIFPIIC